MKSNWNRLILVAFICLSKEAISQEVFIDMTNYQSGFVAVKLVDSDAPNDTLYVDSCGGVICNYPESNGQIKIKFSLFVKRNGMIDEVPDLFKTKRVKRKKLYFVNGFFMSQDDESFLILKIGNKKQLSEKIEIDSPEFDKQINKVLSCL